MNESIITCSTVRTEIKLTESLSTPRIESTAGVFGYLQGIAGKMLPEIQRKDH
jgi:hypothetical protein